MPITGRSFLVVVACDSTLAMPQAAPTAFARTCRMNGFMPRMSETENIIVMSLMPTKGAVSPDAVVETMILGKP